MRKFFATLALLLCSLGCAEKIEHDTVLATKRAVEFAETIFVRRDLDKAYALLADNARSYVPFAKFAETVNMLHSSGYPTTITVVGAAAPVQNEKVINVVLRTERSTYTVTLVGTATSDYRVMSFEGGSPVNIP
jgi:hypothetical protein